MSAYATTCLPMMLQNPHHTNATTPYPTSTHVKLSKNKFLTILNKIF